MIILAGTTLCACANPIPPSKTAADLENAVAEYDRINEITTPGTAPSGTASYAGFVAADVIIDDESGSSFLGELSLSVDFTDEANGISGTIDDITLYDEGVPDQDLGGELTVAGGYDGAFNATATGSLSAVEETGSLGLRGSADITLNMMGDLIDDAGTNTFVGDVSGGSTGGDYSVQIIAPGGFYAVEE